MFRKKKNKKQSAKNNAPATRELISLLWPYFKPDAGLLGVGAVALLVSSFSNAAAPALLRAVIDGTKDASSSSSVGGTSSSSSSSATKKEQLVLVKALGVFAVGAVGSWLRTRCLGLVSARVGERLRKQLMAAVLAQECAFFDGGAAAEAGAEARAEAAAEAGAAEAGGNTGPDNKEVSQGNSASASPASASAASGSTSSVAALEARLGRDVDAVGKAITSNLSNVLRYASSVACGGFMVCRVGSVKATLRFACLGAGVVLVLVPASLLRKKKLDKARALLDSAQVTSSASVIEVVGAMHTVKAFAREAHEEALYAALGAEQAAAEENVAKNEALYMGTLDLGVKASAVTVVAYGAQLVRRGLLSAGQLASFTMYSGLAGMGLAGLLRALGTDWQSPTWRLLSLIQQQQSLQPGLQQGLQQGAGESGGSREGCGPKGGGGGSAARAQKEEGGARIQMIGVEFQYSAQGEKVLGGVDLEVSAGEVVVLVGSSGCGKSTLAALVLALYKPTKGRVLIDGLDVQEQEREWVASQIGVVQQGASLWSRSVRENIQYGHLGCSDSDVEAAAKAANAHDFISTLPQGYDTVIGQGGQQLSGGQKQRIAIARAIVKKPRILLLDEATASLDPDGEVLVVEALKACMAGRTVFAIAHNPEAYYKASSNSGQGGGGGDAVSVFAHKVATLGGGGEGGGSRVQSVIAK